MSKLNTEVLEVLRALIRYTDDSHTEYSLDDCIERGDIRDRADELVDFFVLRVKGDNRRKENER